MRTSPAPGIRASERAGFTLVEILVVLVIICVGLGMVAFAVTARPADYALQREAEELASWIRAATSGAAESGVSGVLRYDLDAGALTVRLGWGSEGVKEEAIRHGVSAPVRMIGVTAVKDGVEETHVGSVEVAVFPDGTCEPHLVVLVHEGVGERTLEVNPITGDVAVLPGRRGYDSVGTSNFLAAGSGR